MDEYRVCVIRKGYVTVHADNEDEAKNKAMDMDASAISWEPGYVADSAEECPFS